MLNKYKLKAFTAAFFIFLFNISLVILVFAAKSFVLQLIIQNVFDLQAHIFWFMLSIMFIEWMGVSK